MWNHTLYALSLSPNDFEIRLALLLHDIGKPHCYIEGETRRFPNHPLISKEITMKILRRLAYEDNFMKRIGYLVEYHDSPISLKDVQKNRELSYKRYVIQCCDAYAHHPNKLEKRTQYLSKIKTYFKN